LILHAGGRPWTTVLSRSSPLPRSCPPRRDNQDRQLIASPCAGWTKGAGGSQFTWCLTFGFRISKFPQRLWWMYFFCCRIEDIIQDQQRNDSCHHPGGNGSGSDAFHAKERIEDSTCTGKGKPFHYEPKRLFHRHRFTV
jgi:hypothetical protein